MLPPHDTLLTAKSLNLSLAPPRATPTQTAHHAIYCGKDPCQCALTSPSSECQSSLPTTHYVDQTYGHLSAIHEKDSMKTRPHPHLLRKPLLSDQSTRILSEILPVWLQNKGRDSGFFRLVCDGLVTSSIPMIGLTHIHASKTFVDLTRQGKIDWKYGPHPMQKIDLFMPNGKARGFVFFVHGGAWGSGKPFMYRLVAKCFLDANIAVAIVGYRTYPDGSVRDQVDDLDSAARRIAMEYPHLLSRSATKDDDDEWIGACLMGHSSGAHISFMLLVKMIQQKIYVKKTHDNSPSVVFDSFVGLSGVYSISDHFDYEAMRGVEEISPMKPACGYSREAFESHSPAMWLKRLLTDRQLQDHVLHSVLPDILLVHGIEDDTVPFTSTSLAGLILKSCGVTNTEMYIPACGHSDVVMHLMFGGKAKEEVLRWLCQKTTNTLGHLSVIGLGSRL